jgi:hypothetical protein
MLMGWVELGGRSEASKKGEVMGWGGGLLAVRKAPPCMKEDEVEVGSRV